MILEERDHAIARGAPIFAEVVGFGLNTDGKHVTQPNAGTMAIAMKLALESAGLKPADIGYVNAHGTATQLGDVAECAAMTEVFGEGGVPMSTIKNYTGHTLGACGAIEALMAISMMNADWYAPNLNLKNPDPACGDQDFIVGEGRKFSSRCIMSNNFAFGGVNTSLVFARV